MKCPDCERNLVYSSKKNIHSFQCSFCGFQDKIRASSCSKAYDLLIQRKNSKGSLKKVFPEKITTELPTSQRKTREDIEKLIEMGGTAPDTLPSAVKRLVTNPDIELIYYKFLKQKSPALGKENIPLPQKLQSYLKQSSLSELYKFQIDSFKAILSGEDIVIVAPTGTGKTEAFILPLLTKIWNKASHPLLRRGLSAIIIYPTKALAKDQAKKISKYGRTLDMTCEVYDGDTPSNKRTKILESPPDILITNPDMLHYHLKDPTFREIIRTIDMVVIDEIHVAVGAFGSNLHFILKRMNRLTKNNIQLIGCSATIGNAQEFASKLFDREIKEIKISDARKAPTYLLMVLPWGMSQYTVTAEIARQLVNSGHKTLCFQNSHKNAEITNLLLKNARIKSAVHRAGLTKEYRNKVEAKFRKSQLQALVSTPTLELGIDIGDVDGVVSSIVDITSFIQRLGRAGRKGQESVGTLILRNDDPISTYYSVFPKDYFGDVRKGYVEPQNEIVSYYQILAAILEKPISKKEFIKHEKAISHLKNDNLVRETQKGIYRVKSRSSAMRALRGYSIRGMGDSVQIQNTEGKTIGKRSMPIAARELHPGAIYLHGGRHYRSIDFKYNQKYGGGLLIVEEIKPVNYKTTAMRFSEPTILAINERKSVFRSQAIYCDMKITENVVGYKISDIYKNQVKEIRDLEEPIIYTFNTKGFVFSVPKPHKLLDIFSDISEKKLFSGSFHAVEHVVIESSSMLTGGGSSELGGIAMGESGAIFVYDGAKGGSGLSKLLYDKLEEGLKRSLKILENCDCTSIDGCPKCTYSYQCGNNNQPLNKIGAIESLKLINETKSKIVEDFEEYEAYV